MSIPQKRWIFTYLLTKMRTQHALITSKNVTTLRGIPGLLHLLVGEFLLKMIKGCLKINFEDSRSSFWVPDI